MIAAAIKIKRSVDFIEKLIFKHNPLITSSYIAYFLGTSDKSLEYNDI